jgi:hypothetical protein
MANAGGITKRVAIDKANLNMVIIVGIASFVTVFCLFASKAILSQNSYQARVISADDKANQQLQTNIKSYNNLADAYSEFVNQPINAIGGSINGTGDNDGSNAKIVLDSLPYKYDFPALTSSVEKVLTDQNLQIEGISGTDNQLTEQGDNTSPNPTPTAIPFTFSINEANYQNIGQLMTVLQQSIRPIGVDSFDLSGSANDMTLNITAHTYYQPGKTLTITKKVVQ